MAQTASRSKPQDVSTSVYVYGVTRADNRGLPNLSGIGGARVGTVAHRRLAAIVSPAPEAPVRTKRRELLAHMEVLQNVFEAATVLPVQFGSVFPSGDVLADELLGNRYDELVALLRQFEGFGELRVRATYRQDEILAEVVRGDPSIARLRELTLGGRNPADPRRIQLGEAVARRLASLRERDARSISSTLLAAAHDAVVEEPRTEYELLRASYLVERGRVAEFDALMNDLARGEHDRITFSYTGPLPPHSFVSLTAGRR
jgi:hypothetical protein